MKKKLSIFWSTILIVLPVMLTAVLIVLYFGYSYVYLNTYEHYEEDITKAASVTDKIIESFDLDKEEDVEACNKVLEHLCKELCIPYIYVLNVDTKANTVKYRAIGVNSSASKKFLKKRHIGDVINTTLDDGENDVIKGKKNVSTTNLKNQFGETLLCYKSRTSSKNQNEIIGAEVSVNAIMKELKSDFRYIALITIIFTIFIVVLFAAVLHSKVSKPAKKINNKMKRFISEREKGFEPLSENGSKEFSEMASSFNSMADEIDRYLNEISEMNRQKAELNIAREIQQGLLEPSSFECGAVSIEAFMHPAKDVGGDLYDYIELKGGKICTIIADVSGKGVSAALFMARAITMLHQYAESGMTPGKILYEYNNRLAYHNPNMLFITTFVGIYDPETGELVYANAGHNYPYIVSDKLIKLDGEQGMAAGIFQNQTYNEYTVKMKTGDLLFLYTDGVTEAKNNDNILFSDEALEKILYSLTCSSEKEAICPVLKQLKKFANGAKQADDITMLTMKINRYSVNRLHLDAKEENLEVIFDKLSKLDLPKDITNKLRFMAEEMFINICSYAYPEKDGTADIIIETNNKQAVMTFIDRGIPFDPTKGEINIDNYDIDNDIGGLGRFLTFSYADDYSYKREDDKNILTITKNIK